MAGISRVAAPLGAVSTPAFAHVPLLLGDKKRRVNVTLEPSLIAAIDEAARVSGTSRSDYLAHAAWRAIEQETGAVKVSAKAPRSARRTKVAGRTSKVRTSALV